ncbi:hypothetical protein [Brachybacterium sp. YJGR34]|uniref:hypothetical protein n=1 Tax=Brachybacterium sp. YJGR34 TaxID=2059911 RepID=UPI001300621A|nr:hypothetical protein [Brachybacterium sp. YJGR34]
METSLRPPRPLLLPAVLAALISAGLGLLWLIAPETSPLPRLPAPPPLLGLLGPAPLYAAMAVAGLAATAVGAALLSADAVSPRVARLLAGVGALEVAVVGLGLASMATLAAVGYLLAMAMPVIVLVVALALVSGGRGPRRLLGAALLVLLAVGIVLGRGLVLELVAVLGPALLDAAGQLLVTLFAVLVGALWAVLTVLTLRSSGALRAVEGWTVRHRRALTLLAACGPLPYALARLTWLTPWPVMGGGAAEADPATRLWGMLLSTGAWLGVLLTIGLIRPWGEVFPRWFPVVGGRPVPVLAAAVPGFAVAALLIFAAVPMLLSAGQLGSTGMLVFALVFPCWFWGPALALAVWGYVGHRRAAADEARAATTASARMGA